MESFSKVIEAAAHLFGVLAWPSVVLIIVWYFRNPLKEFFKKISEGSFKFLGIEASAKMSAVDSMVIAQKTKNILEKGDAELTPEQSSAALAQSANLIAVSRPKESAKSLYSGLMIITKTT